MKLEEVKKDYMMSDLCPSPIVLNLIERIEELSKALERVNMETKNTPLLTDGAIVWVQQALMKYGKDVEI